jgi:methionyl-tRNA formyltransferase
MSTPRDPWRIVFMGTPEFAVPALEALVAADDVVVAAAVTQPDRATGRGQRVAATPIKAVALRHAIAVHQPETLRDPRIREELGRLVPDLIVVAAYGKLLPRAILNLPAQGCVNVHASLLPRHRGAAPVQWALLEGDATTGVTIMRMNEGLDEGDILLQRTEPILATDTATALGTRLAHLGARTLLETIRGLKEGSIVPRPQDPSQATLAPRIRKEMGRVDWCEPAHFLERKVRAFQPWPTAYTSLCGRQLKILKAAVRATVPPPEGRRAPGMVVEIASDGIAVATGDGILVLRMVQLEGKKALSAADFLRGHPLAFGDVLGP